MATAMWKSFVNFDIHHYYWESSRCRRTSGNGIRLKEEQPEINLAIASENWEASKTKICGIYCPYLKDLGPNYHDRTECANYIPPYSNYYISCKYAPANWKK